MASFTFTLNDSPVHVDTDGDKPLLWVLRDELKLTGTKYGCGVGICGSCMVLIDDAPNHACMMPVHKVAQRRVHTIEGLEQRFPALPRAWIDEQVPQCGYCQPGQLMTACALLEGQRNPTAAEIDAAMSNVLCRCGTYQRIRRALRRVIDGKASQTRNSRVVLATPAPDAGTQLDPFIKVHGDNSVTVQINHSEMGQGALTAMAMLAAEELEMPLERMRTAFAPAHARYKNPLWGAQFTGGSSTVRGEWTALREHAVIAREKLIHAAAQRWRVKPENCRARDGAVINTATSARFTYAELAESAAQFAAPKRIALKIPAEFRLVGRATPRLDVPDMVAGETIYGLDVVVPNAKVALIARSPHIGGRALGFDARETLAIPGVRAVKNISRGIAVVADDFWSAWRGREELKVTWSENAHAHLDHAAIYAALAAAARRDAKVVNQRGNAAKVLRAAKRVLSADYQTPYLSHATIEPMNCTADVRRDRCDIWVGTQSQVETQSVAMRLTGLAKDHVHVHTQFVGGGFGRRLNTDFVVEAVETSIAVGEPVKVVWTRGDDLRHGQYRPADHVHFEAALDDNGHPAAWLMRIAGDDLALDGTNVPYAVTHFREEHAEVASPLPTAAWRSVGASQNCFAIESFIDELAHAARRDPLTYRLALLAHAPREQGVLRLAAEKAGWGRPLPKGRGRGIALFNGFGSWAAQVAEVSLVGDGIRVDRIVCAVDCGMTVNPDQVRAQVEGGIAFALSAALKEEIRVHDGRVVQETFREYPLLTFAEMPQIDVHIFISDAAPGGIGEPPIPPVAPAVANAIYAASGIRLRHLPLEQSYAMVRNHP